MSDERPMPPMYFSLRTVQPFAKMSLRDVEGEEGVQLTIADDQVVGMLLPDVRLLKRLEEICEKAGVDPAECWRRVRGDVDRNAFYGTPSEWASFLATDCDPREASHQVAAARIPTITSIVTNSTNVNPALRRSLGFMPHLKAACIKNLGGYRVVRCTHPSGSRMLSASIRCECRIRSIAR